LEATGISRKTDAVVEEVLKMIEGAEHVALDIETTGLDPHEHALRLLQISTGQETYVIDSWSDNVQVERVFEALAKKTVLAHNAKFEWSWVYCLYGIELRDVRDTMLMSQVLVAGDKSIKVSLGAVARRELNIELDKEMQTSQWSSETLTRRQLDYAALDAQVLLPLYERLAGELVDEDLTRVAEIENAAVPAVARMGLEGLPVDKAAWDAHAHEVEEEARTLERRMLEAEWMPQRDPVPQTWALQGPDCLAMLHSAGLDVTGTTAKDLKDHQDHELVAGLLAYRAAKGDERERLRDQVLALAPEKSPAPAPPWNFGSPQQVAVIVEEILGERPKNTSETELLKHVNEHPLFSTLLDYRKLKKRATTYGEGWFKDAYDEPRGRVRPGWRQIGTSTGRFACSEPNAQNLPNDGPYRSFFVAPAGRTFVDVDYSQIEVRIIAKLLEEEALLELYENDEDVYRATAAKMLDLLPEDVTKKQRELAKALVLGMLYGLSAYGLPNYAFKNYGIKMGFEEAEDYVEAFYALYPKIAEYHRNTRAEFYKNGSVDRQTLAGRRRDGITVINEAINMPVQGAAADGLKIAMARVHERLKKFEGSAFIVATIHDELLIECDEGDADEILGIVEEAMVEAMNELINKDEPKVPIKVEGRVTKIWTKD